MSPEKTINTKEYNNQNATLHFIAFDLRHTA